MIRFWRWLLGERVGLSADAKQRKGILYEITIPLLVRLADVSFYQEKIDFVKMKAGGLRGVIIRAGQRNWLDIKFMINWLAARLAGLPRGSYWFYDSRDTPQRQAALWWSVIRNDAAELFHVADLEEDYKGSYGSKAHFKTFIQEFQRLSGLPDDKIVIYTGFYWWGRRVGNDPWFKKYRLWLAWYSPMSVVKVPAPWVESDLILWQDTSHGDGTLYGVSSGNIDLNWFNGTEQEYENFISGITPPEETGMIWYKATGSINIRNAPNGEATGQYVLNGDILETSQTTGGWVLINRIYRDGAFITIPPISWCGTSYLVVTDPPVIVEPPTDSFHVTFIVDHNGKRFGVENLELPPMP